MLRLRPAVPLVLALGTAVALAQETTWNCRDRDGRVLLTNQKEDTVGKDCRVVQQSRVSVVPAQQAPAKPAAPAAGGKPPAAATPSPAGFPRETPSDRLKGRERQRALLEGELAQEERLLAQAKQELSQQESVRTGDERNYAKVLERLQKYRDNVEVHEKNVEALKRELSNLYR